MYLNVYALKIGRKAYGVPFYAENHQQAFATILSLLQQDNHVNFSFDSCPIYFIGVYDTDNAHITPTRKPIKVRNHVI